MNDKETDQNIIENETSTISVIEGADPAMITEEQIANLAQAYARVFGAEPWCEIGRCFTCGNFFSQKGVSCPNDGSEIEEAYPLEWTIRYIQEELSKQGILFVLTRVEESIVSFGWGYETNIFEITRKIYSQDATFQKEIASYLTARLQLPENSPVFYISEIGTIQHWRGRGLATRACSVLLEMAQRSQIPSVTRTIVDPPSIYGIVKRLGMIQVSGPCRGQFVSLEPLDRINSRRTLFVKSPNI